MLHCGPTGVETIKNLVLGGIHSFTLVDDALVWARDEEELNEFVPIHCKDRLSPAFDAQAHGCFRYVLLLGALDRSVALKIAPPGILVISALAAIGVPWLMMRYGRILPGLRNLGPLARADRLARSSALLIPLAIYVAFFAATACVFWLLAAWMFGGVEVSVLPGVAAAFVSGWLLGNITPSAPGGIGVREAVILPQLAHLIGGPQAVVVVVMFRLVTIGGDVLFFAVASWLAAGKTRNPDSREPVPR